LLQSVKCLNWKMKGKVSVSVMRSRVTVKREPAQKLRVY
jgi:hypothetical protein